MIVWVAVWVRVVLKGNVVDSDWRFYNLWASANSFTVGESYSCFYRDYATRKQKEVDDKALLRDKRDRGITCLLLKEGEVWWKLLLRLSHKVCRLLSSVVLLRKFTSVLKKTRRNIPDRLRTPPCLSLVVDKVRDKAAQKLNRAHPRRPRGSQSGPKRREESFQVQAKEPLGTD